MYIIDEMQMALIAGGRKGPGGHKCPGAQPSTPDYSSMSREELGKLTPEQIGLTDADDPFINALYDAGDMLGLVEYVKKVTGIDCSILLN